MFRVLFFEPRIAGNTGNAIRLAAATGAELHLVEPLGFDLSDAKLKRAGLDYHDLAVLHVHADFEAALVALQPRALYAYTAGAARPYTDVSYSPDDVLMFGPEPTGLPDDVLQHSAVTDLLRLPMLAGRRSMNLANCASIVVYEAWRQHGFDGSATT